MIVSLNQVSPACLNWEQLPADMLSVFPPSEEYTYIIQLYAVQETKKFDGAPALSFNATGY